MSIRLELDATERAEIDRERAEKGLAPADWSRPDWAEQMRLGDLPELQV